MTHFLAVVLDVEVGVVAFCYLWALLGGPRRGTPPAP